MTTNDVFIWLYMYNLTMRLPQSNGRQTHRDEKLFHLSPSLRFEIDKHPVLGELYPVHAGYFPEARGHLIDRPNGYDSHQICLCLKGQGIFKTAKKQRLIKAGDLFLARAETDYFYQSSQADPWDLLWVHFKGQAALSYLFWANLVGKGLCQELSREVLVEVKKLMLEVIEGLGRVKDQPQIFELSQKLRALFALLQAHSSMSLTSETMLSALRKHLEVKGFNAVALSQVAAQFALSESRYRAKFKEEVGLAPGEWLMKMRLEKARDLMLLENLSVTETGRRVGFEDPFHFSRNYKKYFGISPKNQKKH